VERDAERLPDRRPGGAEQAVGQAQTDEAEVDQHQQGNAGGEGAERDPGDQSSLPSGCHQERAPGVPSARTTPIKVTAPMAATATVPWSRAPRSRSKARATNPPR